jgi:hypothetical protein
MATELLFEAVKIYIEPLLNFGSIYIVGEGEGNPADIGYLVEREHGNKLYFINDYYKGGPDEVPYIYPVLPLSDNHYLTIKETKGLEIFNPFTSVKHMELVLTQARRGIVNEYISPENHENLPLEQLEDLINFYYSKVPGGSFLAGFSLMEDPQNPQDIFTYIAASSIEAMWGLCVTAYNHIDRRHDELFYTPEKSWKRAMRLIKKWEEERRSIVPKNRESHQEDFGFAHMDLTEDLNYKVREYGRGHFIDEGDMDSYLFSLFSQDELKPAFGDARPLRYEEKEWTFPDFAIDKGPAKARKGRNTTARQPVEEQLPVKYEIIEDKEEPEETFREPPKPTIVMPVGMMAEEALNINQNPPPEPPPAPPPVQNEPPAAQEQVKKPEPMVRKVHRPQPNPPMSGMPGFGALGGPNQWRPGPYPYPMGQANPYGGQAYPPMGPPPPYRPNNVPNSLDDIDFVSNDHPDPFVNYRNGPW